VKARRAPDGFSAQVGGELGESRLSVASGSGKRDSLFLYAAGRRAGVAIGVLDERDRAVSRRVRRPRAARGGEDFGNIFSDFLASPPCAFYDPHYNRAMHEALLIPDDLEACQQLLRELAQAYAQLRRVHEELLGTCTSMQDAQQALQQERDELQLTIQRLLQQLYGRRSERWQDTPGQQYLDFGEEAEAESDPSILSAARDEEFIAEYLVRRRQRPQRPRSEQLPEHLERRTERIEPTLPAGVKWEDCQPLGVDVVETLQYDRAKVWVRRIEYPKYKLPTAPPVNVEPDTAGEPDLSGEPRGNAVAGAEDARTVPALAAVPTEFAVPAAADADLDRSLIRKEEPDVKPPPPRTPDAASPPIVEPHGILQAPREPALCLGGRFGFGVATEVLFSKFVLHVPLYRQQDMWAQSGWSPSRSTLGQIVTTSAELLVPLAELLRQRVLASSVLGTDDTPVRLLTPGAEAGSREARFWLYRGPATAPFNVFAFTDSRAREGPDGFLETFTGTLTGDCYSGYVNMEQVTQGRIRFAACLAHARRKVFDTRAQYPALSSQVLALVHELYDVEDRARPLDDAERRALRQRESVPLMAQLRAVLDCPAAARVLPKSSFGEALAYLRNHWAAFQLYLDDGRLPIDNNDVERDLRRVAIGRKNWLFLGSEDAGDRTATILSVISSAHRHDLDVWAYLHDVLEQLARGPRDLQALLPDVWKAAHPEHVRTFREQEKETRAAGRRYRRACRRQQQRTAVPPADESPAK
jgi:transposase